MKKLYVFLFPFTLIFLLFGCTVANESDVTKTADYKAKDCENESSDAKCVDLEDELEMDLGKNSETSEILEGCKESDTRCIEGFIEEVGTIGISKTEFETEFNKLTDLKGEYKFNIAGIEEMNKGTHLVFNLTETTSGDDGLSDKFIITALNNPVNDELSQLVVSSFDVNSIEDSYDEVPILSLLGDIYNVLFLESDITYEDFLDTVGLLEPTEEEVWESFRIYNYDIFVERSVNGLLVAFHPLDTFSEFVTIENAEDIGELEDPELDLGL